MQSTKHTTTRSPATVAVALGRRWPVLTLGICALLALAILASSVAPARAAPAGQTPANQNPAFDVETATREVPQNSLLDTKVGAPIPVADDQDGDAIYLLDGPDKHHFKIDPATRQISVGAATTLNHEAKPTYHVKVDVTDRKDDTGANDSVIDDSVDVTIKVTDVKEPPGKPAPPTVRPADTDGDTTLAISWTPPENTGPRITGYDVQYRAGNSGGFTDAGHSGAGTSITIPGLQPATEYQVQVRARNDEGDGQWSDSVSDQTGNSPCEGLDVDQDDDTTPGATVDLDPQVHTAILQSRVAEPGVHHIPPRRHWLPLRV